jgi:hypothetical protein
MSDHAHGIRDFGQRVGATLAGLFVGMAVNMAIIQGSMALHGAPADLDWNNAEAVAAYIGSMPWTAFVLAMVAHLAQAFCGGWVAARLTPSRPMASAMIIGTLSALGGIASMQTIPHPWWMWIELPLYFVVAWAAGRLEQRRRDG